MHPLHPVLEQAVRMGKAGGAEMDYSILQILELCERELMLFAGFWFAVGALDELAVDLLWLRMLFLGRGAARRLASPLPQVLSGPAAVFVPSWQEAAVLPAMVQHTLGAWRHRELRLYVGVYGNDPATLASAAAAAGRDPRVRLVVNARPGPTTKADCLNRLYEALCEDEARTGMLARSVTLQDAEDLVHPDGLSILDQALDNADFAQLPVIAEVQHNSRWVSGHYCDEFAEAHAKIMPVREALGAGIPAAGVGCTFSRAAISRAAERNGGLSDKPFAAECLTEDYELGILLSQAGRGTFVRVRDAAGALVATREFFPDQLGPAVRQKTRWMHGIAFQGWDRLGWHWEGNPAETWMRLRDRRGPLTAVVLAMGYLLIAIAATLGIAEATGHYQHAPLSYGLEVLLTINLLAFAWRAMFRAGFTGHLYGWREGARAIARIPVANVIAIMAGHRAMVAYIRVLLGSKLTWEKTVHRRHPALAAS